MLDLDRERIPQGLDEMEPGPVLAGFLASIDVSTVSGYDRVVMLKAHTKMASHYAAQTYRDMVALADALIEDGDVDPDFAPQAAAAEVRAALALTPRVSRVKIVETGQSLVLISRRIYDEASSDVDTLNATERTAPQHHQHHQSGTYGSSSTYPLLDRQCNNVDDGSRL